MIFLRLKILTLILVLSSIGYASPPILPISIDSLMSHLGIQGFRTEIVGEKEPFGFELLIVENGEVVDQIFLGTVHNFNGEPDIKAIEIVYSKLNRSQYTLSFFNLGHHGASRISNDYVIDWKGANGTYGTSILEVGGDPYMFTGDLFSGSFVSSDDLRKIESVKYGLMIRVLVKE